MSIERLYTQRHCTRPVAPVARPTSNIVWSSGSSTLPIFVPYALEAVSPSNDNETARHSGYVGSNSRVGVQITIDVINWGIVQRVFEPADHTDRRVGDGLIHHIDAASQYTSIALAETLVLAGIAASVGSIGDAYDNALAGTTIGLFKTEAVGPRSPFRTARCAPSTTSNTPLWSGSTGTTPAACTASSAMSHPTSTRLQKNQQTRATA